MAASVVLVGVLANGVYKCGSSRCPCERCAVSESSFWLPSLETADLALSSAAKTQRQRMNDLKLSIRSAQRQVAYAGLGSDDF